LFFVFGSQLLAIFATGRIRRGGNFQPSVLHTACGQTPRKRTEISARGFRPLVMSSAVETSLISAKAAPAAEKAIVLSVADIGEVYSREFDQVRTVCI
jgi:hypothetical protein